MQAESSQGWRPATRRVSRMMPFRCGRRGPKSYNHSHSRTFTLRHLLHTSFLHSLLPKPLTDGLATVACASVCKFCRSEPSPASAQPARSTTIPADDDKTVLVGWEHLGVTHSRYLRQTSTLYPCSEGSIVS